MNLKTKKMKIETYAEESVCNCGGRINYVGTGYRKDNDSALSRITGRKVNKHIYKCNNCGLEYQSDFYIPRIKIYFKDENGETIGSMLI